MTRRVRVLVGWVLLVSLGAFLGTYAAAQIIAFVIWRWFGLPGIPAPIALLGVMFFAGFAHGAAVGVAEGVLLRQYLRDLRVLVWTFVTALGAGVAWAVGIAGNLLLRERVWSAGDYVGAVVVGGLTLGAVLGVFQWAMLRRVLAGSAWWIAANALGWVAGMAILFWAASTVDAESTRGETLRSVILGGAGAGVAIGLVTGLPLIARLPPPRRRAPA